MLVAPASAAECLRRIAAADDQPAAALAQRPVQRSEPIEQESSSAGTVVG
jgi:hypothetical protein